MSDQPYQYDPSGTQYQFNSPIYATAANTSAQAAGWELNPAEQQQDTNQPVDDPSQQEQANQIAEILGMDPNDVLAMSTQELYQVPMTPDQENQLSQILWPQQN